MVSLGVGSLLGVLLRKDNLPLPTLVLTILQLLQARRRRAATPARICALRHRTGPRIPGCLELCPGEPGTGDQPCGGSAGVLGMGSQPCDRNLKNTGEPGSGGQPWV